MEFAELAYERQRIYINKTQGLPKPWTYDEIFQTYFFCNVFRRIDKTTEWIMENVARPLEDDDHLWASLIMSRYVSRIDALKDMSNSGAFDPSIDWRDRMRLGREAMLYRRKNKKPMNTAAFITSPMIGDMGPTKAHYIYNLIMRLEDAELGEYLEKNTATIERTHSGLKEYRGVGNFMAYQYICDFSYLPKYLFNAPDVYSWSAPGPGSMRGMKRILYGKPIGSLSKGEWLLKTRELLQEWIAYVERTLGSEMLNTPDGSWRLFQDLRMQDVQHWLCEYDKYKRGGSKKRRYYGVS